MTNHQLVVVASHDHGVVALSVLISLLAAYAARDLLERLRDARGRTWVAWLAGGATVDGIGTWSMHYTGKLALRLPVPLLFDWPTVVLSLLVGIVGSAAALWVMRRGPIGFGRALAAGTLMGGIGISGLHYISMSAMRLQGMHHYYYSPGLIVASVLVGILLSAAALTLNFDVRDATIGRGSRRTVSVLVRGMANPVMHYTAMAAVVFVYSGEAPDLSHAVSIASLGILGISIVPAMVLVVALLTSLAGRLQRQGALLDELFEQAPQAVALMTADHRIVRVNREFTRVFGYTPQETLGRRPSELISLDASQVGTHRDADVPGHGDGDGVHVEGVRQRKDRSQLHVSMIQVPVSVPGGPVEIYAIYRDITERKRADEALRTYRRGLIDAQETERRSIARELHDEIGQVLTSVRLALTLSQQLPGDLAQARVIEAQRTLDRLITQVRTLALDLRPAMLDDFGLAAALSWLVERHMEQTDLRIELIQSGLAERRFSPAIESAAYRIVQEGLTNVVRHAEVRIATVRVWADNDTLTVQVDDAGVGFDADSVVQRAGVSIGLAGMRERASILGGHFTVETSIGVGTCIRATLPLRPHGNANSQ
jgi:PAS domain S-box-containing protein